MSAAADLHKAHRDASEKYIYFLLAAAGASIAFATTQTATAQLNWAKLPLGFAVLCWASSFYSGCRELGHAMNFMQRNYQYLRVRSGEHPDLPAIPQVLAFIEKDLEEGSNKSGHWARWQFRLLIGGALSYILWHITEMTLRIPAKEALKSPFLLP